MHSFERPRLSAAVLACLAAVVASLWIVGSAGAATTQLLTNGSFETGNFAGWAPSATTGCDTWRVWTSPASPCFSGAFGFPPSISAVDGNDFASVTWDGVAGSNPELTQVVSIPANSTDILAWSDNISWDLVFGATADRIASVNIVSGSTVLASTPTFTMKAGTSGNTGWVGHTLDLSAYAGQTVGITFHLSVPQTFTGPAIYSLDGVTLNSTPNLPTSKDQCKNAGWQSFGQFKNQGDCVSFVATGGKNPPAGG